MVYSSRVEPSCAERGACTRDIFELLLSRGICRRLKERLFLLFGRARLRDGHLRSYSDQAQLFRQKKTIEEAFDIL